jgi:hypothetical protein
MATTTDTLKLTLGDVSFAASEAGVIAFGGDQKLNIHHLVGGKRIIDAMGVDPAPLQWSGIFTGAEALTKALTLQRMMNEGRVLDLTWSKMKYRVVIRTFGGDFEAPFRIPYHIVCEVLDDQTVLPQAKAAVDAAQAIKSDAATAKTLTEQIGDGVLSQLVKDINSTVTEISDFITAKKSDISKLQDRLTNARTKVTDLLADAEKTLASVGTVGGLIPGNVSTSLNHLSKQINATLSGSQLTQLDSTLSRISKNLDNVNTSVKKINVAGGNLYDVAAKVYGKATAWTALAKANKKEDPNLDGTTSLDIPANSGNPNGIYTGA